MKEKYIEKLKEWFGDLEFSYEILDYIEGNTVFLTVCDDYESNQKRVELYRVFGVGDRIEISGEFEYTIDTRRDSSIAAGIADAMNVYKRM